MLKYWRLLIVIVMVLAAVLAIGLKAMPYGRQGVEVVFVSGDSPARDIIEQGAIITHINNNPITDKQDWDARVQGLSGNITLTVNAKKVTLPVGNNLGIEVRDRERTNLEFGLDINGGTRILLEPRGNITEETLYQTTSTLETRANVYGLQEIKIQPIITADSFLIQIDASGVQRNAIEDLLTTQGSFEAKVIKPVDIGSDAAIQLGQELIPVIVQEDDIIINNQTISPNGSFALRGIKFEYANRTSDRIFLLASVYGGSDIELIPSDPQSSAITPQGSGYSFYFTVVVSSAGAQRFADVTAGIPSYLDLQTGERYLDSEILLLLDDELVSQLRISEGLRGEVFQSPQIQGFRETYEEAFNEKLTLQTILRSGALPTRLETVSASTISPALGKEFFTTSVYAAILAAGIVFIIVLLRYRSFRVSVPLILITFSEITIILGIAAAQDITIWSTALVINLALIFLVWWKRKESDMFAWIGAILIPLLGMMSWTIDLPAIGGIIAAIGTGVNDQLIIADEALRGRKEEDGDIKNKIKRAMFIVFGAAATIIAAMVPLLFLGVGVLRGFAITTMTGVFVGLLITRPAYAKIVESMAGKKQQTPHN